MKKRRDYKAAIQIDPGRVSVKLIPVIDDSNSANQRAQDILDTAAKVIFLASKRGPVKKSESEGDEYAA